MIAPMTSGGIVSQCKNFLETGIALVQNRLELVALELQEEKSRAISIIVLGATLIFLGFMGVIALMLTLVFLFWEHALIVMGGFTGVFLLGALVVFLVLKGKLKKPIPFSETISQLKKDRAWIQSQR
jgi:uncharacterized membrane protein YqjE